jgi:hypothetical protein
MRGTEGRDVEKSRFFGGFTLGHGRKTGKSIPDLRILGIARSPTIRYNYYL